MIRVVPIFVDSDGKEGFSEQYYFANYSTPQSFIQPDALPGADKPVLGFLAARRTLYPYKPGLKNLFIDRIRVSVVSTTSPVQPGRYFGVWRPTGTSWRGRYKTAGNDVQVVEAYTRLLVTWNLDAGQNGRLFLGACPEDILAPPSNYDPDRLNTRFASVFNNFWVYLRSQGFRVKRESQQSNVAIPIVPIQSFTLAPDGLSATITPPTAIIAAGQPTQTGLLILRGRKRSSWNGQHRFTTIGGAGNTVLGPVRGATADFGASAQGSYQMLLPEFQTPSGYALGPFVEHRVGDPLSRFRGRRTHRP